MVTLKDKHRQAQSALTLATLFLFMLALPYYLIRGEHMVSHLFFYVGCVIVIGRYFYYKFNVRRLNETNYLNFWIKNLIVLLFTLLWMPFSVIAAFFSNGIIAYYQLFFILLAEIPISFFIWWLFFDKKYYDDYARKHSFNIKNNRIEQIQVIKFSTGYSLNKYVFLRKPLQLLTSLGKFILILLLMLGGGAGIVISEVLKATILEGQNIEVPPLIFFIMGCFIVPFVTYCILPLFTSIRWWEALKAEVKAEYGSVEIVELNLTEPELNEQQEELDFIRREKERVKEEKKKARKTRDEKIYDWLNK